MKELHITDYAICYKLSFNIKGPSKPLQAVMILLIKIINKAQ
jgi:hypothetical protein